MNSQMHEIMLFSSVGFTWGLVTCNGSLIRAGSEFLIRSREYFHSESITERESCTVLPFMIKCLFFKFISVTWPEVGLQVTITLDWIPNYYQHAILNRLSWKLENLVFIATMTSHYNDVTEQHTGVTSVVMQWKDEGKVKHHVVSHPSFKCSVVTKCRDKLYYEMIRPFRSSQKRSLSMGEFALST